MKKRKPVRRKKRTHTITSTARPDAFRPSVEDRRAWMDRMNERRKLEHQNMHLQVLATRVFAAIVDESVSTYQGEARLVSDSVRIALMIRRECENR